MRPPSSSLAFLLLAACTAPPAIEPVRLQLPGVSSSASWRRSTQSDGVVAPITTQLAALPSVTIATIELVLFTAAPPDVAGAAVESAATAIEFALAVDDDHLPRPALPSRPARELRCLRGDAARTAFVALAAPGWPHYHSLLRDETLLSSGVGVGLSAGWSEPLDSAAGSAETGGTARSLEPELGVELELRGDEVRVVVVRGAPGAGSSSPWTRMRGTCPTRRWRSEASRATT